jgi:hypothetical protein
MLQIQNRETCILHSVEDRFLRTIRKLHTPQQQKGLAIRKEMGNRVFPSLFFLMFSWFLFFLLRYPAVSFSTDPVSVLAVLSFL